MILIFVLETFFLKNICFADYFKLLTEFLAVRKL